MTAAIDAVAFGPNIWTIDGPDVAVAGFRYPTRMAIIRLRNGGLFIWSPIALTAPLRNVVDQMGNVEVIVAPNAFHHLALLEWIEAYPAATVPAPPGLRRKRPDIAFSCEIEDCNEQDWQSEIAYQLLEGSWLIKEMVFYHRQSRTIIFTDLLQNFDRQWFSGWRKMVARLDGLIGTAPKVPRKFRMSFADRKAARNAFERVRGWPCERILMAHGTPVKFNASACLEEAFTWLKAKPPRNFGLHA